MTLRRENQQLRIQAMQAEETARENDRLRQLLGWQRQAPWKLKLARVVLREPANWWRTVQIDLGSRDGMRVNLPVLTAEGLVGRISSVSLTRSQVVLLGDPDCKVAARGRKRDARHRRRRHVRAVGQRVRRDGLSFRQRQSEARPACPDERRRGHFPAEHPDRDGRGFAAGRVRPRDRGAREAGGEPERAGGSVGAVPMNWLHTVFVLAAPSWRCSGKPPSAGCGICSARRWTCCRR